MSPRGQQFLGAALYLALMTLWIYGDLDRHSDNWTWASIAVIPAQVALGLAVSRWWAVALPILVVAISIPAGYPPTGDGEPFPLWFGLGFGALFAIPLVAVGVASRKIVEWRRS